MRKGNKCSCLKPANQSCELESKLDALTARCEKLERGLMIAANQLEGVALAIEKHGINIDSDFFIIEYKRNAEKAREAIKAVEEN